jgi:hypothetical protein
MSTIDLSETDKQILARHSPGVRGRALIELQVVDALIRAAQEAEYRLEIADLEEDYPDMVTPNDFKLAVFNLDDAMINVYNSPGAEEPFGWVRLVFGNDGWDLVSDYSVNLEAFLAPVQVVADFWGQ